MARIKTVSVVDLKELDGWSGPEWEDRHWFIYFMQGDDGGPIKIGKCKTAPLYRLSSIQTGYPFGKLGFAGLFRGPSRNESELHRRFDSFRIRGEWFRPEQELVEFILSLPEPA